MNLSNCAIEDLRRILELCIGFLKQYQFLSDLYLIEFFTDRHWEKLPYSWQNALGGLEIPNIAEQLLCPSTAGQIPTVLPLSLLCFKKCTTILSVSRTPFHTIHEKVKGDSSSLKKPLKHVTPKKQHEIVSLSRVISGVYGSERCSVVIDVGSGQGHLSRMLSLGHNLPVIALEHDPRHVNLARKYDCEATEGRTCDLPRPVHILFTIMPDIDREQFIGAISKPRAIGEKSLDLKRCLLTGLHACGDLSATMLRLFVESDDISAIVSVACCYIKLTTDSVDPGKVFRSKTCPRTRVNYPMSRSLEAIDGHQLSYRALKLACHGLEGLKKTLERNDPCLKTQCYRAILEHVIRKHFPTLKRPAVKTVNRAHSYSFDDYVQIALQRLNLNSLSSTEYPGCRSMLEESNKVIVLFTLCVMLGPVLESVILLDRIVYLAENEISSRLLSVFDPEISPRCFAIIATKH